MKLINSLLLALTSQTIQCDVARAESTIYSFVTIAGLGPGSADGTNSAARFNLPVGVAVDTKSNIYVADFLNNTIRKLTPFGTNWVSSTIAGLPGTQGGGDGTNSDARFSYPSGVALDAVGNVYVADAGNFVVRKLIPAGTNWVSSTIAGLTGNQGSLDGTNSDVRFAYPSSVAVDRGGNVYVADSSNNTIRKLTPVETNWVSSTIAGLARSGGTSDGTNSAARFSYPVGIAVSATGEVYVADVGNNTIRKLTLVETNWVTRTIAGLAGNPGDVDGSNSVIRFESPWAISVDAGGSVYVADLTSSVIRRLTPVGTNWVATTIAGLLGLPWTVGSTDGANSAIQFNNPEGIAEDNAGNIYVADASNNTVRKLTPVGTNWVSSTIAGLAGSPGSADGINSSARFAGPIGVTVDNAHNLYVADFPNKHIRKLTLAGSNWVSSTIAELAGSFRSPSGVTADRSGNLYVADPNNYTISKLSPVGSNWLSSTIAGLAGNSGSTDGTNSAARFNWPYGVAVDRNGNVYVTDQGNHTVRKLTPAGESWVSSTIAGLAGTSGSADGTNSDARFDLPQGLAVDDDGNVYVADAATVRKLTPIGRDWVSTTIAGTTWSSGSDDGSNSDVQFEGPAGVAVDAAGHVYVTDGFTIRKLTPVGSDWISSTIAGSATSRGSDDGIGSAARFGNPIGIAVDGSGNLFVADNSNRTIREGFPLAATPAPPVLSLTLVPQRCPEDCPSAYFDITWSGTSGLTYRLQYTSDLSSTNWHDLRHGTASAKDAPGEDPQRFYRIILLP